MVVGPLCLSVEINTCRQLCWGLVVIVKAAPILTLEVFPVRWVVLMSVENRLPGFLNDFGDFIDVGRDLVVWVV